MHKLLIALAAALAMGGCASHGGAPGSATAEGKPKTKRVCTTGERQTGSNMPTRVCRNVVIDDADAT